jgi:hypothetical protein
MCLQRQKQTQRVLGRSRQPLGRLKVGIYEFNYLVNVVSRGPSRTLDTSMDVDLTAEA